MSTTKWQNIAGSKKFFTLDRRKPIFWTFRRTWCKTSKHTGKFCSDQNIRYDQKGWILYERSIILSCICVFTIKVIIARCRSSLLECKFSGKIIKIDFTTRNRLDITQKQVLKFNKNLNILYFFPFILSVMGCFKKVNSIVSHTRH